jgi:hypothetical protein
MIDKISKSARKRRNTTVVDLFDNRDRERTIKQSVLTNIAGPISKRKYVTLSNLKNK